MTDRKLQQEPMVAEQSAERTDEKSRRLRLQIEALEERLAPEDGNPPTPPWPF